ncbi:helix-turn-helix transcriptional regulator [Bacteroides nordii]|uniref:LexA family transcriptional regulator n=1 Tax=Bacteroides nordii TaxID=291645 RepID=UPI00399AF930
MNAKERFIEYLKMKGIGQTSFEQSSGLSRGSISQKSGFSANSIEKIAIACPDLNLEWLILGNEPMLKSESQPPRPETLGKNAIKYYPAVNGSMGGVQFLDCPDETSIDIILPGFAECKFAINAYGDSMYPVIKSGQVVLLMEWKESFIDWGHIYMVVTKSGYRTIKYVRPSEKEGFIRCESENKESNPAFDIEMEDIHKLFLVKGWVCRDTI